jgi:LPS-assembly protein
MSKIWKSFVFILFNYCLVASGKIFEDNALKASKVYYDSTHNIITAIGDVFIKSEGYSINAQKIVYDVNEDIVFAENNVQVTDQSGKVIVGTKVVFKNNLKQGIIKDFVSRIGKDSIVAAKIARRLDENEIELENSVFSPCKISCKRNPIWQIRSEKTHIDYDKEKIVHRNLFFEVYGMPVFYLPYIFHPTPQASAKSGILMPQVSNEAVIIPFYFRLKPNIDFTIIPKVAKGSTIFDTEYRHQIKNGSYQVNASYSNASTIKNSPNQDAVNYYLDASSKFVSGNNSYGFNIHRASGKAFLTDHHEIYDSNFTSRIYLHNLNIRDYFLLEGNYFQDLINEGNKTPFIFPSINTQNIFSLSDDETTLLNVNSDVIVYAEPNTLKLARMALGLELTKDIISQTGHVFTFEAANRSDLYLIDFESKNSQNALFRYIPEVSAKWRYPLISPVSKRSSLKIEPIAKVVIGKKYNENLKKFGVVDELNNELSENNIFCTNRFGGIDYHEYGKRLSYGINSTLLSTNTYVDTFIGHVVYKDNIERNSNYEYVGNIRADMLNNYSIFYRFRKDRKLKPIKNELRFESTFGKFIGNISFVDIFKSKKNNKMSQININADYWVLDQLSLGLDAKIDSNSEKLRFLTKTIRMTYNFDCVSISAMVKSSFLYDQSRGIEKEEFSPSFSIGLKVLNM